MPTCSARAAAANASAAARPSDASCNERLERFKVTSFRVRGFKSRCRYIIPKEEISCVDGIAEYELRKPKAVFMSTTDSEPHEPAARLADMRARSLAPAGEDAFPEVRCVLEALDDEERDPAGERGSSTDPIAHC